MAIIDWYKLNPGRLLAEWMKAKTAEDWYARTQKIAMSLACGEKGADKWADEMIEDSRERFGKRSAAGKASAAARRIKATDDELAAIQQVEPKKQEAQGKKEQEEIPADAPAGLADALANSPFRVAEVIASARSCGLNDAELTKWALFHGERSWLVGNRMMGRDALSQSLAKWRNTAKDIEAKEKARAAGRGGGDVTVKGVRVASNGHAASDDIDF